MGQKVNPRVLRITTTYHQPSRWYASKQLFAAALQSDIEIRKYIREKCRDGGVARVEFERALHELTIRIHTSKPGVIIGRGGAFIEEMRKTIKRQYFGSQKMKVNITIHEVENPEVNAELLVQNIRDQLEKRIPFRRVAKRILEQVLRNSLALGCKIQLAGRLNGAEIARTETFTRGRLPLHTLRANIDYSRGVAQTIYGAIGIKVWVYKGDVFEAEPTETHVEAKPASVPHRRRTSSTGGKKLILRKRSDIQKEQQPADETPSI